MSVNESRRNNFPAVVNHAVDRLIFQYRIITRIQNIYIFNNKIAAFVMGDCFFIFCWVGFKVDDLRPISNRFCCCAKKRKETTML